MAVDMFMKFKPEVKGESSDKVHKESIDVLAWSWGLSQTGSMHVGTGGGSGKVNVQDLSFTKYVDKSSPTLMLALCQGKHFDTVNLIVRKAGGESPLEYIKVELKGVIVSSISTGGSGGEDRLTENVTLNFAEVKYSYQPQDNKGAKQGGEISANFNIAENTSK